MGEEHTHSDKPGEDREVQIRRTIGNSAGMLAKWDNDVHVYR